MKISLFQGILFGVCGLAALIGLFVFATHTSTSSNTGVGNVTIWGTLPKAAMENTITTAGQTDPALKNAIISYVQEDPTTLSSDLASAIATGQAPDLVLASQEELHSLSNFITPIPLATLSQNTFTNTFVEEGALFAAPNSSGYYGIPFLVDPLALFSNRTILESDGVASPPATWEALTGLVPRISVLTPSRQISRGLIALGTYDNVHDARAILSALFLQSGVPISAYSTGGALSGDLVDNGSSNGSPGQAALDFYTQFADPSRISYTWNESFADSQQSFLSEDVALYIGFASEASFLTAANPNLDFVVSPLPQPATASVKRTYGLVYAFMIPRGAKNPAGAYQVAALMTNSTEQSLAASNTGLAPATLSQLAIMPSSPIAAVAYSEGLYARGWLSPAPTDTDSVFSSMIGSVISGKTTSSIAIVNAENSLSSLLQQ